MTQTGMYMELLAERLRQAARDADELTQIIVDAASARGAAGRYQGRRTKADFSDTIREAADFIEKLSRPSPITGEEMRETDSGRVHLAGYLEELLGSKRGLRYVQMGVMEPYQHTVILHITGDDDDALNAALFPLWNVRVNVSLSVDQHGELCTTPDQIALCDTDGSPEGPDRNGLDGEAATAGAAESGIAQPLDPLSRISEA